MLIDDRGKVPIELRPILDVEHHRVEARVTQDVNHTYQARHNGWSGDNRHENADGIGASLRQRRGAAQGSIIQTFYRPKDAFEGRFANLIAPIEYARNSTDAHTGLCGHGGDTDFTLPHSNFPPRKPVLHSQFGTGSMA